MLPYPRLYAVFDFFVYCNGKLMPRFTWLVLADNSPGGGKRKEDASTARRRSINSTTSLNHFWRPIGSCYGQNKATNCAWRLGRSIWQAVQWFESKNLFILESGRFNLFFDFMAITSTVRLSICAWNVRLWMQIRWELIYYALLVCLSTPSGYRCIPSVIRAIDHHEAKFKGRNAIVLRRRYGLSMYGQ
jgi:hypothetical protein